MIDQKGELLGKLAGQQLGWWMVRLGRCGLADFFGDFFWGYICSVKIAGLWLFLRLVGYFLLGFIVNRCFYIRTVKAILFKL